MLDAWASGMRHVCKTSPPGTTRGSGSRRVSSSGAGTNVVEPVVEVSVVVVVVPIGTDSTKLAMSPFQVCAGSGCTHGSFTAGARTAAGGAVGPWVGGSLVNRSGGDCAPVRGTVGAFVGTVKGFPAEARDTNWC